MSTRESQATLPLSADLLASRQTEPDHSLDHTPTDLRRRSPNLWREVARWAIEVCLLIALAIWATWPLARHLTTHLPNGTEPAGVNTVALLNLWTLWWNADRLAAGYENYWQAPIFFPTKYAFALTESQSLTGLLAAPLVWADPPGVLAYNLVLLTALVMNGVQTLVLLRSVPIARPAALAGAAMVTLLPFLHWQLGVFQLVPLTGILLSLHVLVSMSREPRWWHGLILGAGLAIAYHQCAYHAMFFGILLLPALRIALDGHWKKPITWLALVLTAMSAAAAVAPHAVVQLSHLKEHLFERSVESVRTLSITPYRYLTSYRPQLLPLPDWHAEDETTYWCLSPGTLKYALALIGLAAGVWAKRFRRLAWASIAMIGFALVLGAGNRFVVGGLAPDDILRAWCPGYGQIRNMMRYGMFVQLLVVFWAAGGLQVLWQRLPAGVVTNALISVLALVALFELPPGDPNLLPSPTLDPPAWTDWLRTNTPAGSAVVVLPLPQGRSAAAYRDSAVAMTWQPFHQRPLVNGYAGVFPPDFIALRTQAPGSPTAFGWHLLARRGTRYAVMPALVDPALPRGVVVRYVDPKTGQRVVELSPILRLPLDHDE